MASFASTASRRLFAGGAVAGLLGAGAALSSAFAQDGAKANVPDFSSNDTGWISIGTNQPPTNTFTFTDATPATNGQRFYRVRQVW